MTKLPEASTAERRDGGADVIIVGAGVGGSALAYALAKDGRRVHVIERDMREPERMMGEIMQPGGRFMLAKLGLQDSLEGIDEQKLTGLKLYKDGKEAILPFPVENNNFPYEPSARSFHNGRFVQRLRQKASSLSNVRLEEGTVKSLIEEKGVIKGVTYKTSAGEETTAFAPLTVVCDGYYSNLRRSLINNNAEVLSYGVGYISKNCRLEESETVHLIMSKPSFTLFYQISSTEVRCISEVSPDNVPSISNGEMATFFKNTLAPQIPPKLREILMKGISEGAKMKGMATKNMSAMLSEKKGVFVLGDAFNMRHPVIASGMMVVLSDILILCGLLQPLDNLSDANKVSEVLKSFYDIRKPMSATANTLGSAFSQVLVASTDEVKEAMRQGFFDYLSAGGIRTSEIMALLSGMNPQPLSLIRQLFAMTLSSVGHLLSPFPSPLRIWHSLQIFGVPLKLRKIFLKGIDEGAQIKAAPAKRMAATLTEKKGVIVLGDAFNMRHPVIASGMMVLLSDILILRGLLQPLSNLGDANKVSKVIKSFYQIRKPMTATVNTLGNAFSQVLIASTDEAKEAMRQGCYDYLSSGGFGTSEMMTLVGGMNPRPLSLIYHLCAITMSSICHLLFPFPSPLRIWHSLRLFGLSMKMLLPHVKAEGVSQMFSPAYAAAYRKSYMATTAL